MFAALVSGISFVDVAAALISVGASILGVVGIYRGLFWIMEMLGYSWDSQDMSWYREGATGFGPDGDMSRAEYDEVYPVDPSDPDDWRNYDWTDENDPQGHFH
jgi:hypothetical protein